MFCVLILYDIFIISMKTGSSIVRLSYRVLWFRSWLRYHWLPQSTLTNRRSLLRLSCRSERAKERLFCSKSGLPPYNSPPWTLRIGAIVQHPQCSRWKDSTSSQIAARILRIGRPFSPNRAGFCVTWHSLGVFLQTLLGLGVFSRRSVKSVIVNSYKQAH